MLFQVETEVAQTVQPCDQGSDSGQTLKAELIRFADRFDVGFEREEAG